jgi:hypothetical protein
MNFIRRPEVLSQRVSKDGGPEIALTRCARALVCGDWSQDARRSSGFFLLPEKIWARHGDEFCAMNTGA